VLQKYNTFKSSELYIFTAIIIQLKAIFSELAFLNKTWRVKNLWIVFYYNAFVNDERLFLKSLMYGSLNSIHTLFAGFVGVN